MDPPIVKGVKSGEYGPDLFFLTLVQPLPITSTAEDYGAAIYYNTAIPVPGQPGRVMKYGIISTHALRQDLLDWQWMYTAGRFLGRGEDGRE